MKMKHILATAGLVCAAAVTVQAKYVEKRSVSSKVLENLLRLQPKRLNECSVHTNIWKTS